MPKPPPQVASPRPPLGDGVAGAETSRPEAAHWASVANGVVEACLLFAVLSIPLYFTVLTGAGYEADKGIFLRLIAAVAGFAWLAGYATRSSSTRDADTRWRRALFSLTGVYFLVYLISSALSIDPRVSVIGSFGREEGLWTVASYLVVFVAAATTMRGLARIDRLVTVLLFGSVPVVIYGLLQQLSIDPMPATGDPSSLAFPVWSTFGQHVFFASYLVMIIPLAAARAWQNRAPLFDAAGGGDDVLTAVSIVGAVVVSLLAFLAIGVQQTAVFTLFPLLLGGFTVAALAVYSLPNTAAMAAARRIAYPALLAAQILALIFTGARGAWLGFLVSIPVFGVLLGWKLGRARIWQSLSALTGLVALFLILLNMPSGPLQSLRSVQGLSRLANITGGGGTEGSAQARLLIWQAVVHLMSHTPSLPGNFGGPLRTLIGYGPETLAWAFQAVFPLQLRRVTAEIWTWDRAHNIYLNYLASIGAVGLAVVLVLLAVFFWRLWLALKQGASPDGTVLLIALASGMAGHMVDGFFGIEMAATLLLFWLMVGLVAGLPWKTGTLDVVPAASLTRVSVPFAVAGLASAVALVLLPAAIEGPGLLSAVLLLASLAAIGLIALGTSPDLRSSLSALVPVRLARNRGGSALGAAGILALLLALAGQWTVESAAIAQRAATSASTTNNLALLQEAARLNPFEPTYQTQLGSAYLALASSHSSSGDPKYQPIAGAYRLVSPSLVLRLGRDQILSLGRQAYQDAASLSPLDPDAWDNLGILYRAWGRAGNSLADFRRAELLSHLNPRYLDEQALTYYQVNKTSSAHGLARRAEALDPHFWYSHYALALSDAQSGSAAAARNNARLALFWQAITWPPPPQSELSVMKQIEQSG